MFPLIWLGSPRRLVFLLDLVFPLRVQCFMDRGISVLTTTLPPRRWSLLLWSILLCASPLSSVSLMGVVPPLSTRFIMGCGCLFCVGALRFVLTLPPFIFSLAHPGPAISWSTLVPLPIVSSRGPMFHVLSCRGAHRSTFSSSALVLPFFR